MAMRSFGVGVGAEPTFRLTPVAGLWNEFAFACVTTAADNNAKGNRRVALGDLKCLIVISMG